MNSHETTSTKFSQNDKVEFLSNKSIDSNHLDVIIAFLENSNLSGGGRILDFTIDPEKTLISVIYGENIYKHRILDNKILSVHGYTLVASEPKFNEYQDECNLDKRLLILKNVPELDDYLIKGYAENIAVTKVGDNKILLANRSHYFRQLFYIRFENEIDIDICKERLSHRPTLNGRKIEIQHGYLTNTIFFRIHPLLRTRLNTEVIKAYFMNKKKFEQNPLISIKQYHSFYFIKFNSESSMVDFLLYNQRLSLRERLIFINDLSSFGLVTGISGLFENVYFENLFDLKLVDEQIEIRETNNRLLQFELIRKENVSEVLSHRNSTSSESDVFRVQNLNKNILRKTQIKLKSFISRN